MYYHYVPAEPDEQDEHDEQWVVRCYHVRDDEAIHCAHMHHLGLGSEPVVYMAMDSGEDCSVYLWCPTCDAYCKCQGTLCLKCGGLIHG